MPTITEKQARAAGDRFGRDVRTRPIFAVLTLVTGEMQVIVTGWGTTPHSAGQSGVLVQTEAGRTANYPARAERLTISQDDADYLEACAVVQAVAISNSIVAANHRRAKAGNYNRRDLRWGR